MFPIAETLHQIHLLTVVGYSQSDLDLEFGAVMTCAQFSDVANAKGKISLDKLQPVAAEKWVDLAGAVEIQLLNDAGETIAESDYMWDGNAWVDGAGEQVSDVSFEFGQGLWVYNYTGEIVGFRSAGQVVEFDLEYPLDLEFGAVGVGNPYPVKVNLDGIVPVTEEEWLDLAGAIEIQLLNDAGETIAESDYMWDGNAWVDGTGSTVTGVQFSAGQGLWVYNYTGESVNLRIPAPEIR